MKIISFKLQDDGYKGVHVIREEAVQKQGQTILDEVLRKRGIPIPNELRSTIDKLKFHFLSLTRQFQPEWKEWLNDSTIADEYFSQAGYKNCVKLWDDTTITGLNIKNGCIQITGKINMIGEKIQGLTHPAIVEEDGYEYFGELESVVKEVTDAVAKYLDDKNLKMMTGEQYAMKFCKEDELEGITDKEEYMIEHLTKKGYFVGGNDEMNIETEEEKQEVIDDVETKTEIVSESKDDLMIPQVLPQAGSPEAVEAFKAKQETKKVKTKVIEEEF
jgi:hypothetical protein